MLTKQNFIDALSAELHIIRHLGTKVEPTMLDYRPTSKQRSMGELMQYLGHVFLVGMTANIAGDVSLYATLSKEAPVVTIENFDLVMQMQIKAITEKIESLTEEDMAKEVEIFGMKASVAVHLLNVMKWATAYKMQFFLYLKSCGKEHLNTMNLWRGVDPAPTE